MKILAFACTLALLASFAAAGEPGKDIRPILFKPIDDGLDNKLGGQSKAYIAKDATAAEEFLGKADAKALAAKLDFTKEQLVLVSWTTSGPPDGTLKHEIKGAAGNRALVFFVQAPAAPVRGQRARIGMDLFAVPRDLAVLFDAKERR
ncbi:MAG: hypothetical protein WCL32_24595 [Planctomycetota bacterium]|jgi:hypothetical protein